MLRLTKNNLCWIALRTVVVLLFSVNLCFAAHAKSHHKHHARVIHHPAKHAKIKRKHTKKKYYVKKHHARPHQLVKESAEPLVAEYDNSRSTLFSSSLDDKIATFVNSTVASLRYTSYRLGGTHFDASRGVYVLDCSSYVDNVLRKVCPRSYSSLVNSTGSIKPTTNDYYRFFIDLANRPKHNWAAVEDANELQAGDILVFRYKNHRGNETGGHVMIVMNKPIKQADAVLVKVADSASGRHSHDTRSSDDSGIGIGTLSLKLNSHTGEPVAFAWQVGSRWHKDVHIAMARPAEKTG